MKPSSHHIGDRAPAEAENCPGEDAIRIVRETLAAAKIDVKEEEIDLLVNARALIRSRVELLYVPEAETFEPAHVVTP